MSDISKFTKISRVAVAASDIWGVLKYHKLVFIPNTPKKPCYFLFILQGKEIFALYVTGVIFTCKYFKFGLNTTGLSQSHFRNLSACSINYNHQLRWSYFSYAKANYSNHAVFQNSFLV